MPVITFIASDGERSVVSAHSGDNVMRTALAANVPGILAECGGAAMCATCHVYVDDAASGAFAPISELENEMLDCTAAERLPTSRLSCQLITPDSDITILIPQRQT